MFTRKGREKLKLKNTFNYADIYYKTSRNGKTLYQYPKILDVRFYENKTVYVFRLPHSVDPKELKRKEHVFKSRFGERIEFKGHNPIALTVFNNVQHGSFGYCFDELKHIMNKHRLPIIAGKDILGVFHSYDMTTNPHLLIAGETGSGKSVMLRAILTSLIQYKRKGLQLHLADLKRSEFHLFRNIDIVASLMNEKKDVKKCVSWFHKQLEKRGDLLDLHEVSHVDELPEEARVDYLVLCIDEFSILRDMTETMNQLIDLSALGRALGIYLILSTQRPDRKIIDGLMKANLTVRYAFKHADKINSRITLGEGAKEDASSIDEEDKGKFFMRFSGCKFIQSPYLTTEDAKKLLEPYRLQVVKRDQNEECETVEAEYEEIVEEESSNENFAPLSLGEGVLNE